MIKKINHQQFTYFYNRMKEEFPASEMKSFEDFNALLMEGKYQCFGYYDDLDPTEMVGYALGMLTSTKFFWLDYLQIFYEHQDGGYGSKFLKELFHIIFTKLVLFYFPFYR